MNLVDLHLAINHSPLFSELFAFVLLVIGLLARKRTLVEALLREAAESEVAKALPDRGFGPRYQLDFALHTQMGAATVRSGWIVLAGEAGRSLRRPYVSLGRHS